MPTPQHLFVYGTLRRDSDAPERKVLEAHGRMVGDGVVKGRLYLGQYPFAVPATDGDSTIKGEVYELEPDHVTEVLKRLDEYEEFDPFDPGRSLYRRELTEVKINDRSVQAWIYWYAQELKDAILLPGGEIGQDVHVLPQGAEWVVRLGNRSPAVRVSATKAGALSSARKLARTQHSKVIVHEEKVQRRA